MTETPAPEPLPEFSLAHGAPFCRIQEYLGLIRPASLQPGRRALLFALAAWLPLAALTLVDGTFLEPDGLRAFARDYPVHARLLLAIPLSIVLEAIARSRLDRLLRQFLRGGLVSREQADRLRALVERALARRNSARGEFLVLLAAVAAGVAIVRANLGWRSPSWLGSLDNGGFDLSSAGWWYVLASSPLFFFLLFRWLWRYALWVWLLRQVARLDLRLVATHPDRAGGLMFISQYPAVFQLLAFAISCVAASSIARDMMFDGATMTSVRPAMIAWVVALVLLFVLPLCVFSGPLQALRRQSLFAYSALATRHDLAFEDRWLRHNGEGRGPRDGEVPLPGDLAARFAAVQNMRTVPVNKAAVIPVALAAAAPMLVAAATQVPVKQLLGVLKLLVI
jgi:hypothetical protein